jgi:maltose 6'-phosphate phosphatase
VNANTIIEDKEINLSSIHFGWSDGYEVFEEQVDKLLENLDNSKINIIAGDFNISPGTKEYDYIIKKGYNDLFYNNDMKYFNIPTHLSNIDKKDGASRIDYVMSNKKFKVLSKKILFNNDLVSDHYGVLLELGLGVIK